jgi:nitrite reductase/ring-hydroxylating ferredoxin subunit
MLRDEQIRIAKKLLAHMKNGTTEFAPQQRRVNVLEYIDPDLWAREIDVFYKRSPIIAGMSCELPGPGTYKALDILGSPVLLVRDQHGSIAAFLNVCRHRGSPVVAEGCGEARRFSCLYHGWTYDQAGQLIGVSNEETFGAVDRDERSLKALPCAERGGIIFVGLTPGLDFDIDSYLAGADRHWSAAEPEMLHFGGTRTVGAANWKTAVEGHLESYHFATLHRDSIAISAVTNVATIDRFGPHILITFASKRLVDLLDLPESEWEPLRDRLITPQYIMFPGTCVVLLGHGILIQMIRPGADVDHSTNRLVIGFHDIPNDPDAAVAQSGYLDMVTTLVEREDYAAGRAIQQGMRSGAQTDMLFGRNEPGCIYFHEVMEAALQGELAPSRT